MKKPRFVDGCCAAVRINPGDRYESASHCVSWTFGFVTGGKPVDAGRKKRRKKTKMCVFFEVMID